MVGGMIFHRKVIQREISRVLVLNLSGQKKMRLQNRQGEVSLDKAFALIEGHPARNGVTCPTYSRCRRQRSFSLPPARHLGRAEHPGTSSAGPNAPSLVLDWTPDQGRNRPGRNTLRSDD